MWIFPQSHCSKCIFATTAMFAFVVASPVDAQPRDGMQRNNEYFAFSEPFQTIDVAAAESGRIEAVLVEPGTPVQQETLLMTLDSQVLRATRAVAVQQAQTTAEIESLQLEQQRLDHRFKRLLELRSQGAGSPDEVLQAETEAKIARLRVQAAVQRKQIAELEIAEIDARIAMKQIRSPITGIVTAVVQDVGEFVAASDPTTVRVVDLSALRAVFYLPTDRALNLKIEETLTLQFVDGGDSVTAVIRHIDPVTNAESGRVGVEVIIKNAGNQHRSGLRCRLQL